MLGRNHWTLDPANLEYSATVSYHDSLREHPFNVDECDEDEWAEFVAWRQFSTELIV